MEMNFNVSNLPFEGPSFDQCVSCRNGQPMDGRTKQCLPCHKGQYYDTNTGVDTIAFQDYNQFKIF